MPSNEEVVLRKYLAFMRKHFYVSDDPSTYYNIVYYGNAPMYITSYASIPNIQNFDHIEGNLYISRYKIETFVYFLETKTWKKGFYFAKMVFEPYKDTYLPVHVRYTDYKNGDAIHLVPFRPPIYPY